MTNQKIKSRERFPSGSGVAESAGEEVVDRLAGLLPREELEAALEGLAPEQVTGPGGLLTQLAGRVIETALGAELTEHLGYPPGQAPPGGARERPQWLDAQDGPDRARARRDQDAAGPQGQLCAAARQEAPDPPGGPG